MGVKMPLNVFFGGISSVQIISNQGLCNVQHPANSHYFYIIVGSVVNFEVLNPKWVHVLNFSLYENVGEIQSQMGEDAYFKRKSNAE